MESIDFTSLENLPKKKNNEKINQIFINLLKEIELYLRLEVIYPNIKIIYKKEKPKIELKRQNILDIGAIRYLQNNLL